MMQFGDVDSISLDNPEYFEILGGLWTGKKPPFTKAGVIRNTNFTSSGVVDYSNVAWLDVEARQLEKRQLKQGDIIIERSGGGPKQPVGRVVQFRRTDEVYSFSNFTTTVRDKKPNVLDPLFVFYVLLELYQSGRTDDIQRRTTGLRNLDFKAYKERAIFPLIPLSEQRRITRILTTVQTAIEQQRKSVALTHELKSSFMSKLFSEGLHSGKQKETEVGLVPESWEIKSFESFTTLQRGKDLTKSQFKDGNVPVAGSNGVIGFHDTAFVNAPGITVGRSGSAGKVTFYNQDFWAHNTSLYVKDFHDNDPIFAAYYLEAMDLTRFKTGASVPTLDRNSFKQMLVAIPPKEEQVEIGRILATTDKKIGITNLYKAKLEELFRTLLHQLMTGQIRMNEIDLPGLS